MAIQWFPGHMHATRKAIAARMREIDVVIELLDARLPGSSANPLLAELAATRAGVGRLKLLTKDDLADAVRTAEWLAHYAAQSDTGALALDASRPAAAQRRSIADACRTLAPLRGGMAKPLRVLICGIPNVGKSTLVNALARERKAKTGDEAGITKQEQRIVLADDFYLWDTPGMLWPRITALESGLRLAASGAIGRNAYDDMEVALALLGYLKQHYAAQLAGRFGLSDSVMADAADEALLEAIARRRGARKAGDRVDLHKAAELVLTEYRSGAIGRITLETPTEFEAWRAVGAAADEARLAKKMARQKSRRTAEATALAQSPALSPRPDSRQK